VLAQPTNPPTFLRFMSKENQKLNRSLNPMDYTFNEVEQLSRFVTETGKILPRKDTGLSAKHQRRITNRIKQARNMLTMK
jgi:small subunit ribosomal protein S18